MFRVGYIGLLMMLGCQYAAAQYLNQSRQFLFSPQLMNVAYTGSQEKTNLVLYYRKQWIDFDDGPQNYGFNFQYPTRQRLGVGFSYNASENVLLKNDGLLASMAYLVPINEDQSIRFGLSGGASFYKLQADETDFSNDPTIINSLAGTVYAIGNFGALYSNKKLKVGIALPELFGRQSLTKSGQFTQLLSQLYSVSYDYKFKSWKDDYYISSYLLYRLSYDYQNNWEAGSIITMKDVFKVGLSYRQYSGLGFLLGIRAVSFFGFSYSYEARPIASDFVNTNSHELHMDFIFNDALKKLLSPDEGEFR